MQRSCVPSRSRKGGGAALPWKTGLFRAIVAAVKAIREWATPLTPWNYLLLGLASGSMLGTALAAVALTLPGPQFLRLTLAVFWLMAFASATHTCMSFVGAAKWKSSAAPSAPGNSSTPTNTASWPSPHSGSGPPPPAVGASTIGVQHHHAHVASVMAVSDTSPSEGWNMPLAS